MNSYQVKRNSDGWVNESCPVNIGVKIGSFHCTANCSFNQTSKKDIQAFGFELPKIICSERLQLPKSNQQLTIEI